MKVVFDIEANGLNPTKIWVIVCKDIDTGIVSIFRRVSDDEANKQAFLDYASNVRLFIGHNVISYDLVALHKLLGFSLPDVTTEHCIDTLIVSRMQESHIRDSHSIESWGEEFDLPKIDFKEWSKYSIEMEEYCVRDVEICHRIFDKFTRGRIDRAGNILNPSWKKSIDSEQLFETRCIDMHNNGFGFNSNKCIKLLDKVTGELSEVDKEILSVFPPRAYLIREIHPKRTKHGTLNRSDFRWLGPTADLSDYSGDPFCRIGYRSFNPDSHKQIIDVLNDANWSPTEKTKTHLETERQARRRDRDPEVDWAKKLDGLSVYGWKINETNLATLPSRAPKPARTLAKRILLESRRRTLTEWSELASRETDGRIRGKFFGIGSWTHRMAHQDPNTANIPNEYDIQGRVKLYGGDMRSLWCAPIHRLLVGVDAEGIQLRIFAHYINDPEFTREVTQGDPHTLNRTILGGICKDRAAAKRFVYAMLLGAGLQKLAEVLDCGVADAEEGLNRLLRRYTGFAELKRSVIPRDARRGYFYGLDGRAVPIYGDTEGHRRHLAMSGYLQNGESVVMKHATNLWYERLKERKIEFKLVDMVHDEWQTECQNDTGIALAIAEEQAKAIKEVGERLGVRCPLSGSYINKKLLEKNDPFPYTIDTNWKLTH